MDFEKQKKAIASVKNGWELSSLMLGEERFCDLQEKFSQRRMACSKCSAFKGRVKVDEYKIKTKKVVKRRSFLHATKGNVVFLDSTTYRIISSWICAEQSPGVVEVFDSWACSKTRTYVLEDCEPYSEDYEKEFKEQVGFILEELEGVNFKSRKLTKEDFFIRKVAFSFVDEKGKHRSGPVKICLRIPKESSVTVDGTELTNHSSIKQKLYSCKELKEIL